MEGFFRLKRIASLAFLAGMAVLPAAHAAQEADFSGKRVHITVPFPPGGGSDVYSRAFAPYLEKHLPGSPTVVIRNVPGGGALIGANQFHDRAKPDGLDVLVLSASVVMNSVFQPAKLQFPVNKAEFVILSPQGAVAYVASGLGVKEPKDIRQLKGKSLTMGGGSPTAAELRFTTSFELLGLDVKYVWGIARGPTRLAFERGEFNINYDTTPGFLKNAQHLVKSGKAIPLFSFGVMDEKGNIVRDPNFPNVPSFPEAYEMMHGKKPSGTPFEAWKALFQMGVMANKAIVLPPGTPKHIVETWRTAVRKALADPGFQKDSEKIVGGYPQFVGDAALPIVKEATTPSPEVLEWINNYLKTEHGVKM